MTSRTRSTTTLLALAATAALTLAACSGGDDDGAEGDPIRVGAVSSITGPAPFPEVPAAAEAVFERVNAEGGIDGRMIELVSEDDGGDPAQASQAARRLVDESGVVAFAGSASLVECSANAAFYAQRDVVAISGTGVEPSCFESANIAPVNNGTIRGYEALLHFASEDLGHDRVCPVIQESAGLTEPYLELIERWEADTGSEAPHVDTSVVLGDDPTPAILAVRDAGCEAVVFNSNEPVAVAFMNAVDQQGLLDQIDWLTLTSAYSVSVQESLAEQGTLGLYANSEFLPYTGDAPGLEGWRTTLTDADVPLTSLSMGGYVAAEVLVEVLEGIDGEITNESVTEAFRALDEIEHPLMGMPFTFGDATEHNPNRSSMMVQATEEGWETVSDWVRLP
ncbi:ABC transporter substrate-binding protein [Georgenia sp. Z1344]|uniref:ABC transporter substrate-binding protein n=1 Tax=Georgenia sp. Z1344 TaxID=3416706 RepID=UPI003CE7680C